MPGVHVPDALIERIGRSENQREAGLQILVESMQKLVRIKGVAGVHVLGHQYEAVRAVLHREHPTPRETLLLIGLATHNHSVELYIQKILLDLNTNEQVSIRAAQDSLAGINHLYRLLQEFRVKKQIAERRYYHYWGGALVACEMRTRGYNDWVVRLVGKILGTVYEEWSGSFSEIQGESFSGSSEDISLHDRGAAWGSALCSHNP